MVVRKLKATRACRPCRLLKVRCLPLEGRDDICLKCHRSGAQCLYEEPQTRKKRQTTNPQDIITALETKVADLIAQLAHSKSPAKDVSGSCPQLPAQGLTVQETVTCSPSVCPTCAGPGAYSGTTSHPAHSTHIASSLNNGSGAQQVSALEQILQSGALDKVTAASYLSTYQQMCAYAPFVMIPEEATIDQLLLSSPFTLHAALVVSSGQDADIQTLLEKTFREQLLQTVMIDGERSVELLQAVILYLAYYHFFYIPMKQHFYQTMQIAISMCVDMKVNLPPSECLARKVGLGEDHHNHSRAGICNDRFYSKAARRALIGCYCLSSITTWIWCKPNNFQGTKYVLECAQSLFDEPEHTTDKLLLPILRIHMLGNRYHREYRVPVFDHGDSTSSIEVESLVGAFRNELNEITSQVGSTELPVKLSALYAAAYGHEMDLLNPCNPTDHDLTGSTETLPLTKSLNERLMFCLQSAVAYFEEFLSLLYEEYHKLSILQWWGLICNTAYLYRLCLGIALIPDWDVVVARRTAKLDILLDLLCYRLESATGSTLEKPTGRDLYSLLCPIFTNVKRSFTRLKSAAKPLSSSDKQPVHANAFDEKQPRRGTNKWETHPSRCPAFRYTSQCNDKGLSAGEADETLIQQQLCLSDVDAFLNSNLFDSDMTWLEDMPHMEFTTFDLDND